MTDELIARLEAATGPDEDLDFAILRLVFPRKEGEGFILRTRRPYTSSVDAALTLVPEGWAMRIKQTTKYDQSCWTGDGRRPDWTVSLTPDENRHDEFFDYVGGEASTAALAICVAALKASAA